MNFTLTLAQENQKPATESLAPTPVDQTTALTTTDGSGADQPLPSNPNKGPFGDGQFFMVLLALMGLMIFMTFRSQSKEKKKRKELLNTLSKGDKVQTIGGILGSIVEIRDNEIIVKVDENSNTKIKFTRSAIQAKVEEKDS